MAILIGIVLISVSGFVVSLALYRWIVRLPQPSPSLTRISTLIKDGANVFLFREAKYLTRFCLSAALCILLLLPRPLFLDPSIENLYIAAAYLFGTVLSALCAVLGMQAATIANAKTADRARQSLASAFLCSFRGGSVMGIFVVCTSLSGITLLFFFTDDTSYLLAFSFGASSLALFAKAGGGIFTKTADISADLVGKVELGMAEDDYRNPAVIADNVGDNVGDVAGMGSDLFDSYVAALVASLVIALSLDASYAYLVLSYSAVGTFATILMVGSVRLKEGKSVTSALNRSTYGTSLLSLLGFALVTYLLDAPLALLFCTVLGLGVGSVIGIVTNHFTDDTHAPVRRVAASGKKGPAFSVLGGFSYGLLSTFPALVGIALCTLLSYRLAAPLGTGMGFFGVSLSSVGMLSIVGMVVSNDAYGPIVDNARGLAQMCSLGEETLARTDALDSAGNTVKAITKGFAIASAGLAVISLLGAFLAQIGMEAARLGLSAVQILDALSPSFLFGLLVGIGVPAVFSALLIQAVQDNACLMVEEIHHQFETIEGLKEGKAGVLPKYDTCIDLATKAALHRLIPAGLFTILMTLVVGFFGGYVAVSGFIIGNIACGLLLALLMSNTGGLWDNAKKWVEAGNDGGKHSDAHQAAVISDTIGDPFKDTAGPSLNTQITLVTLVSSLFASLFLRYSLF